MGTPPRKTIKVVGIGDAGCLAAARVMAERLDRIDVIAVNTHQTGLDAFGVDVRLLIGGGHGAGGNPELGRMAAEASAAAIRRAMTDARHVFVLCGLGGGTGSGGAPVVARLAHERGAEVTAVVSRPFSFEGAPRQQLADAAVEALRTDANALSVVAGDDLMSLVHRRLSLDESMRLLTSALAWKVLARLV